MRVEIGNLVVADFDVVPRHDDPKKTQQRADVGSGNFIVPDRHGERQPEIVSRWEVRVLGRLCTWKGADGLWKRLWYAELVRPLPYRKGERPGAERNKPPMPPSPKSTGPSGRFIGVTVPAASVNLGESPNVLPFVTADMRAAAEAQRRMIAKAPPPRGAAVAGKKKVKGKKQ